MECAATRSDLGGRRFDDDHGRAHPFEGSLKSADRCAVDPGTQRTRCGDSGKFRAAWLVMAPVARFWPDDWPAAEDTYHYHRVSTAALGRSDGAWVRLWRRGSER